MYVAANLDTAPLNIVSFVGPQPFLVSVIFPSPLVSGGGKYDRNLLGGKYDRH